MQRVRFLILVLILELLPPLVKADEIPVLLMLKRSEQIDTSGCNFVEQVTALIYKEIIENKVKLWDSPAKEIQITGATLKEIERNSNTSFVNQETVFMYETWDNVKKEILTKTIGFSFLHKNENEEEVISIRLEKGEKTLEEVIVTDQRERREAAHRRIPAGLAFHVMLDEG